jgi:arginyl-tRNA synthetase
MKEKRKRWKERATYIAKDIIVELQKHECQASSTVANKCINFWLQKVHWSSTIIRYWQLVRKMSNCSLTALLGKLAICIKLELSKSQRRII